MARSSKDLLHNWFRTVNECILQRDMTKARSLLHNDYEEINSAAPDVVRGPDAFVVFFQQFTVAFPDLQFELGETLGEGDKASTIWTARGTQNGPFAGHAPTGRRATVTGLVVVQFKDGLLWRTRVEWNVPSLFAQLGLGLPGMAEERQKCPEYGEAIKVGMSLIAAINGHDMNSLRRLFTPDAVVKNPIAPFKFTVEQFIGIRTAMHDASPDETLAITDIAYDERVGSLTMRGRAVGHFDKDFAVGPYAGYKLAGRRMNTPMCMVLKFRGNKLCQTTTYFDNLETMNQLGALPREIIDTLAKSHVTARVDLFGREIAPGRA